MRSLRVDICAWSTPVTFSLADKARATAAVTVLGSENTADGREQLAVRDCLIKTVVAVPEVTLLRCVQHLQGRVVVPLKHT